MAESSEEGGQAWRPFGADGTAGGALLVLAGVLAGLGLVTALVVMVLWFFVDSVFDSSTSFKTIQALGVLVQPLMLASVVAAIAAGTVNRRSA